MLSNIFGIKRRENVKHISPNYKKKLFAIVQNDWPRLGKILKSTTYNYCYIVCFIVTFCPSLPLLWADMWLFTCFLLCHCCLCFIFMCQQKGARHSCPTVRHVFFVSLFVFLLLFIFLLFLSPWGVAVHLCPHSKISSLSFIH